MLTEELHAASAAAGSKLESHEEAAHEKRNWVRLTFDCNDRCVFCLDAHTHTGEMRDRDEVKRQILDGRGKGATRLILSGGEPTIHPNFVDFVRLGALAGYAKIQTVTNGRLFAYRDFLTRAVDAGLSEITFSIHGPNARIHDALVGVKGAFDEETAGLRHALADGRPVVNVDIVINRANVRHLVTMLETFYAMGVREFDLLQVVPFGRAFTEGRDTLFYDLEEMRPDLQAALAWSRRPDVHLWLNRFPPQHLEGYEHLIQDPYKLNDEVRGRKEEFAGFLDDGVDLDCREPARCRHCYLERLCDSLYAAQEVLDRRAFRRLRVDTTWQDRQEPVFGGDPASDRRARAVARASRERPDGRVSLPVLSGPARPAVPVAQLAAETLLVVAPDLAQALRALADHPYCRRVELELDDYAGLGAALGPGDRLAGAQLAAAVARTPGDVEALLAAGTTFEAIVELDRATAAWLLASDAPSPRLVLRQPTHDRLTESAARDVDLRAFFASFPHPLPVEGIPACVLGRAPRAEPPTLDTARLGPAGRLEIFRYTRRFIRADYQVKSARCRACVHDAGCRGIHVNYVRAHGFAVLQPIVDPPGAHPDNPATP